MHVESAPIKTVLDTSTNYSLVCYIMINAGTCTTELHQQDKHAHYPIVNMCTQQQLLKAAKCLHEVSAAK